MAVTDLPTKPCTPRILHMSYPSGMSNTSDSQRARLNSLNVQDKSLKKLLDQLNAQGMADSESLTPATAKKRDFARWEFRKDAVELQIEHPGGSTVSIRVICRNLSRGGASVLHASFVHVGCNCKIILPHLRRGPTPVSGKVVRCQHRGGVVHELGIAFTKPIRVRDFVATDPFSSVFSLESVDPMSLSGTLVHIEPNEAFRTHVAGIMGETKMKLLEFPSTEAALEAAKDATVILASGDIESCPPKMLVQTLRDAAIAAPVLVVLTQSQKALALATGVPATAFFTRPVSRDLLFKAIAECSLSDAPFTANATKIKGK